MKLLHTRFVLLAAALVVTFARCGSDTATAPPGVVTVTMSPATATLRVGATAQINVTAAVNGAIVTGQTITFTSDNPAVASISSTGVLRALTMGTANITARSSSGQSASGVVTVIAGLPAAITKTAGDNQSALLGTAVAVTPSVTVRDSAGNPTADVPVSFSASAGGGSVTGGSAITNASGIATVGSWTLGTIVGANALTAAVSGLASVTFSASATPAPIASIAIRAGDAQTAGSGAAVSVPPSVIVLNSAGQPAQGVAVTFAVTSGGGAISGASQTTNAAGLATVTSWTLGAVGVNKMTATVTGLTPVTFSATATPTAGIALSTTQLAYGATVGASTAGTQTVRITNGGGGSLTALVLGAISYTGTSGWLTASLDATSAPATITLSTNTSVIATPGSYGASFTVSSTEAQNSPQTVTVTLAISPAVVANSIVVIQQPVGTFTGVQLSQQPIVKFVDANGATVTSMNGPVAASLGSGNGVLSGATTVNAVSGIATFTNLKITGSGQFTLVFSAANAVTASSQVFNLATLPATQLAVVTNPANAVTNTAFGVQPVVQLRDVNGNLVANAAGTVTATVGAGSTGVGSLTGASTVSVVNGVATFSDLKLSAAGTYVLQFSCAALPPVSSAAFSVTQSPPVSLALTTQPGGAQSGSALSPQPVIALRDAANAIVAGANNPVTVTLNGAATLNGTTTVSAVNGVVTFTNLAINGAGTYTLTFSSAGLPPVTSAAVTVTPLPASQLSVATQPVGALTGAPLSTQPVVQVRDAVGALVTSASNPVTATLVGAGGTVGGSATVNAVNGVATFTNLVVTGPGTYTLSFAATGLASTTSAPFTVSSLPASQLAVVTQPVGASSGAPLGTQPVVQIRDAGNAVVSVATSAVTATLIGAGGSLSGLTTVNAVNGVATFTNLAITGPGSYMIQFTAAGLAATTSTTVTIAPLVATKLAVLTQPGGALSGNALSPQPVVLVLNASNGVVAGATNAVTAVLVGAGGALSGTTTVAAVNGVATFTNLVITGAGTYTIQFTATGLTSASSQSVTASAPFIALNVGSSATVAGARSVDLAIPITLDMSTAAGQNLATLQFDVTWDPTKFTFVSVTNGALGSSGPFVNTANSATGSITVGFFDPVGINSGAPTLLTVTLKPNIAGTGAVSARVTLSADANAGPLVAPVVARALTVTTP